MKMFKATRGEAKIEEVETTIGEHGMEVPGEYRPTIFFWAGPEPPINYPDGEAVYLLRGWLDNLNSCLRPDWHAAKAWLLKDALAEERAARRANMATSLDLTHALELTKQIEAMTPPAEAGKQDEGIKKETEDE